MSFCLWVCMLVFFLLPVVSWLKCNRLYVIAISFGVCSINISNCLHFSQIKVHVCVCVFNIHQILIIFCINLLSMGWGCLLKDSTSFRDCLRLVCAFYRNWRTSRAKNSVELYKYAGKRGGKMEGRAKKRIPSCCIPKSSAHKWIENSTTARFHGSKRFVFCFHSGIALLRFRFSCFFLLVLFLFSCWLFIFQF